MTYTLLNNIDDPADLRKLDRRQLGTLADELRAQATGAKVVSLSLKARAAIAMAGRGGDVVAWLEDAGTWATSTAYAAKPPASADAFVRALFTGIDGCVTRMNGVLTTCPIGARSRMVS